MNRYHPFLKALAILLIFLILEGLAVLLVVNNSVVQRYKFMETTRNIQSFFWKRGEGIKTYFSLKRENENLVEENKKLLEKIASFSPLLESGTMRINDTSQYRFTVAEVVKNSTDRQHNFLILNKGSEDGIDENMGVITSTGVVGYIHSVSKNYSMVVSLLNINHTISAVIKNNGTFGLIKWDGKRKDEVTLHDIPIHTEIVTGDTIVTSGYSAIYPKDIPIGVIKSAKLTDGINYNLTIKLFENFNSLRFVYIVNNLNREEINKLINGNREQI